jgi:hypothetical protein
MGEFADSQYQQFTDMVEFKVPAESLVLSDHEEKIPFADLSSRAGGSLKLTHIYAFSVDDPAGLEILEVKLLPPQDAP